MTTTDLKSWANDLATYIRKHPLPDGLRPTLRSRVMVLVHAEDGDLTGRELDALTRMVEARLDPLWRMP